MLIDWFTVIAQVVNFLVLVALLKYLLFDRITRAMDEREQKIGSAFQDAEQAKKRAQEATDRYQLMIEEMHASQRTILAEAKDEADALRQELLKNARVEVDERKSRWCESLEREMVGFLAELRKQIAVAAISVARSVIRNLANAELEHQVVERFLQEIENLPEASRTDLGRALQEASAEITVLTTFELVQADKEAIDNRLRQFTKGDAVIRFDKSSDNGCGVELRSAGHKIGWNLDTYLEDFEKTVSQTIEEFLKTSPSPRPRDDTDASKSGE